MSKKSPRFDWERAVISAHGPESPTTRFVLLVLATYWNKDAGLPAWPSIRTLAANSRLSERAVFKHLDIAVGEGWITRHQFKDPSNKQGWRRNAYSMSLPDSLAHAPGAIPRPDGHAPDAGPDANGHALDADRHARGDTFVMHQVPTNNVLNTSLIQHAHARAHATVAQN
jgi:hypothetical protein